MDFFTPKKNLITFTQNIATSHLMKKENPQAKPMIDKLTPRPYQIQISEQALEILRKYHLVYLALEPRVGKTMTSFMTAWKYGARKILFVTKKKAIDDIVGQLSEMGYEFDNVVVTNYESTHKVVDEFDLAILDEAHSLGRFPKPSHRAVVLKKLCEGKPIIYLSGTPSPESFSQLYYQFWVSSWSPFIDYKGFYKWAAEFVDIKQRKFNGYMVNDYKKADITKIKKMTDHLFLNFSQEDAGFKSFVDETILHVKMMPSTYTLADYLKKHKIAKNGDGEVILADTEVKLMQKLHQIYSGTVIIDESPDNKVDSKVFDYTKGEFIKDYFKGKKIAIYYKFKAELAMLRWVFAGCNTLDPQEFEERDDLVFLSQVVSGREGINLSSADALVFLNIDFSAVSYWQTRARIQTKDRTKDSKIYYIFSVNGIEDKIHKMVSQKLDYTLQYFKKDYL